MKTLQFINSIKNFAHITTLEILIILTGLYFCSCRAHGQETTNIDIVIKDAVLIKKKRQDVLRIRIDLSMESKNISPHLIKNFYRIVPANAFFMESETINSEVNCKYDALFYLIEDSNGKIIPAHFFLHSQQDQPNKFFSCKKHRYLDTLRLRFRKSRLQKSIFKENDLYIQGDTTLSVFPNLVEFHYLQKGTYYLNLYYCNTGSEIHNHSHQDNYPDTLGTQFYGFFKSNKVKVIVE
nr:hypothetical protein [Bacteroidota bacterium]